MIEYAAAHAEVGSERRARFAALYPDIAREYDAAERAFVEMQEHVRAAMVATEKGEIMRHALHVHAGFALACVRMAEFRAAYARFLTQDCPAVKP